MMKTVDPTDSLKDLLGPPGISDFILRATSQ